MLSNRRNKAMILQGAVVAVIAALVALLVQTTLLNLRTRGIPVGFEFLIQPSRLVISEAVLAYKAGDPYYRAILVGLANTIFISAIVIVASPILGFVVGIARLSSNPLAAGMARVWVELTRNAPPIVILIISIRSGGRSFRRSAKRGRCCRT